MLTFQQFIETRISKPCGHLDYDIANRDDVEYINDAIASPLPEPIIEIQDLFVNKEYRGKGFYGIRLLQDFLKNHKDSTIICQAYPYEENQKNFENRRMDIVKMYEKFGFIHVGQGWMYRLPIL